MFFYRGFQNLLALHRFQELDPDIILFAGALTASLVGFVVGALFRLRHINFSLFCGCVCRNTVTDRE